MVMDKVDSLNVNNHSGKTHYYLTLLVQPWKNLSSFSPFRIKDPDYY